MLDYFLVHFSFLVVWCKRRYSSPTGTWWVDQLRPQDSEPCIIIITTTTSFTRFSRYLCCDWSRIFECSGLRDGLVGARPQRMWNFSFLFIGPPFSVSFFSRKNRLANTVLQGLSLYEKPSGAVCRESQ